MPAVKHFHLIVPVWGKQYTELFTDVCLPMLMTPGNLGSLGNREGNQFVIMTTWSDLPALEQSAFIVRLKEMIQVEMIVVDLLTDFDNSHKAMSDCYAMAIRREAVIPGETCYLFLTPDSFWPDGTFRRLVDLVDQDFKVVMAAGLRTNREAMSKILREQIALSPDNPAIPLPELVRLALAHLHDLSRAHNILSFREFLNQWPSHIYWINERDEHLVAHCFHLHPLLVVAHKKNAVIGTTIDGEFLDNLSYPLSCYYVMQDCFGIELSPDERNWGQPLGAPSLKKIIHFSLLHANSRHWHFFSKRIYLDGNPTVELDPVVERLANECVARIEKYRSYALLIQRLRLVGLVLAMSIVRSRIRRLLRRVILGG